MKMHTGSQLPESVNIIASVVLIIINTIRTQLYHNEEGEEEYEDSGHDELDVTASDAPLLLLLLGLLVQLHAGHY